MATVGKTVEQEQTSRERLISLYMEHVLENGEPPKVIYKFCKDHDIREEEFYNFFGSFDGLKIGVWEQFFEHSMEIMQTSSEYPSFTTREKMLTFYYTFFEVLTANRSFVLFTLKENERPLKNLTQLQGLRRKVKGFGKGLIATANEEKQLKLLQRSEFIFSEAVWVQLLFLMKFWMDDNSSQFESTDIAIEKSVNTVFDLFDNSPLERILDFGKFLWKEKKI